MVGIINVSTKCRSVIVQCLQLWQVWLLQWGCNWVYWGQLLLYEIRTTSDSTLSPSFYLSPSPSLSLSPKTKPVTVTHQEAESLDIRCQTNVLLMIHFIYLTPFWSFQRQFDKIRLKYFILFNCFASCLREDECTLSAGLNLASLQSVLKHSIHW